MEYQMIINLLDNTPNQPSKFRTKNLVKINDESHGVCNIGSQITFKTSMLRSSLCNYCDTYIGTIAVPNTGTATALNNRNKGVVFKNCAPFTDCLSDLNNRQSVNAKEINLVMNM